MYLYALFSLFVVCGLYGLRARAIASMPSIAYMSLTSMNYLAIMAGEPLIRVTFMIFVTYITHLSAVTCIASMICVVIVTFIASMPE